MSVFVQRNHIIDVYILCSLLFMYILDLNLISDMTKKKISLNKNEYNKKQYKFIFEIYVNISQVVACMLYLLLLIEEIRDFLVGY